MLDKLMKKGCNFLGSKYTILGGAMSWVSDASLVSAISNAGGFGVIASGSMPPNILYDEITKTYKLTNNNFGVNLITMHPKLNELIDVCIEHKIKYVVLAGGIADVNTIKKLQTSNIKIICFAPALSLARRLVKYQVDAIIIEGMEAGGHIGPVSTSVLSQEILPMIKDIPVFVAGGIGTGAAIANYLLMGAAGCQLGTKFVCTYESIAHQNFKQAFIKANARHATVSVQIDENFPVIPVRAITNKATKEFMIFQKNIIDNYRQGKFSQQEAQLEIEHFWAGSLKRAVIDGDIENGSIMAGQSVEFVTKEETVQEVMKDLISQAEYYLSNLQI